MTVKVIKQYTDKYTKKTVYVGATLRNLSPEREKELLDAGVVEKEKKQHKGGFHEIGRAHV